LGLVAANSLQLTAHALITLWLMRRRVGRLEGMGLLVTLTKVAVASLAMGAVTYATYRLFKVALPGDRIVHHALRLGGAGVIGLAVYAVASLKLQVDEARMVLNLVRQKTGR
jgi:putative peptidoglycan lipid II flippase